MKDFIINYLIKMFFFQEKKRLARAAAQRERHLAATATVHGAWHDMQPNHHSPTLLVGSHGRQGGGEDYDDDDVNEPRYKGLKAK